MSFPKSAGEPDKYRAAQVGKLRLKLGVGKARVDFLVEPVDDFSRRVLRCTDALPCARFVAGHKFVDGRDVRQRLRARRGRHRERAELAGPDVLNRCDGLDEVNLHLSGEQISEREPLAAIRHVDHSDAGHHLE